MLRISIHPACSTLLTLLAFGAPAFAQPVPAPQPTTLSASTLQFPTIEGAAAKGIVCDNLRGMPDKMRDCLKIGLPLEVDGWTWTAVLTNPDGSTADRDGRNNVGEVKVQGGTLLYYPPDEFNLRQEPATVDDVSPVEQREVELKVSGTGVDGTHTTIESRPILLERPTVVMVHGINSSPVIWEGDAHNGLRPALKLGFHFDTVALNYGKDDFKDSTPNGKGALYFKGNGPVEYLAGDLRDCIEKALQQRRRSGFETLRADVVAHSYGGILTRWYLKTGERNPRVRQSRGWYRFAGVAGSPERADAGGYRKLYWFQKGFVEGQLPAEPVDYSKTPDIRKVITLASPWRGVPLSNVVNEVQGPVSKGPALGEARLALVVRFTRIIQFLDFNPVRQLHTRAPSYEVGAVNSPWLKLLDEIPFHDNVAYGAITGYDNGYIASLDPYTALSTLLSSGWFPYLRLEQRSHQKVNYSDGLMPIWTAAFPGRERLVAATHDAIVIDNDVQKYVLVSLSSAALPLGQDLNHEWNGPIRLVQGNKTLKTWTFGPGGMAPVIEDQVYQQIDGVGRINPEAIYEIRKPRLTNLTATGVTIHWQTAVQCSGAVKLYLLRYNAIHYGHYDLVRTVADRTALTRDHAVPITGLQPGVRYYYVVESPVGGSKDGIVLQSSREAFTTPGTIEEP